MPIPKDSQPLVRQSAQEMVYDVLCDWIVSGKLLPGEKVNDIELSKHFGVSRTPVREALQLLKSQKLIQFIPGKATVVAEVDKQDIEKCYRPLAVIQALAAEQACPRFTEDELQELDSQLVSLIDADARDDLHAAISSDMAFHDLIMKVADNEYMADFSRSMILHIQRIKYHYFCVGIMRKSSIEQHAKILDAFRAKDGVLAASLMRDHWLFVMDRCLTEIM